MKLTEPRPYSEPEAARHQASCVRRQDRSSEDVRMSITSLNARDVAQFRWRTLEPDRRERGAVLPSRLISAISGLMT